MAVFDPISWNEMRSRERRLFREWAWAQLRAARQAGNAADVRRWRVIIGNTIPWYEREADEQ